MAFTVWAVLTLTCAARTIARPASHTVYPVFSHAARAWLAADDLYVLVPRYDYFRYSPLVAAFFVPWQPLGDGVGGAAWRVLGMILLAAGLGAWRRRFYPDLSTWHAGLLALLMVPFLLPNVNNGQSNPHLLGLLLLGAADAAAGRFWRSAAWFALATAFKPYLVAVPLLVALAEPRLWGRLLIALAAVLALPFLLNAPDYVAGQYVAWVRHLGGNDRTFADLKGCYRDVSLLFRVYLVPLSPAGYLAVEIAAGLVMAALVIFRPRPPLAGRASDGYSIPSLARPANKGGRNNGMPAGAMPTALRGHGSAKAMPTQSRGHGTRNPSIEIDCCTTSALALAFALGTCWVTLFGPATESCTYLLLAPALAAEVVTRPGRPGRWPRVAYALFAGTAAAGLFPQDWRVQALGPQAAGSVILMCVLLAQKRKAAAVPMAAAAA